MTSTVNWSPSPIHPPTKMIIYPGEEATEPIRTINLDPSQNETSLDLKATMPADAMFTLASSFKLDEWEEGERQRLFFTFPKVGFKLFISFNMIFLQGRTSFIVDQPGRLVLTPPVITTIDVLSSSNSLASRAR